MELDEVLKLADWPIILGEMTSTYGEHFSQYSYTKYPAAKYQHFKDTFSAFAVNVEMESALLWKWGHWGKANYPTKQGALIAEISALWPEYLQWVDQLPEAPIPKTTFLWWGRHLGRLRYITTAYLTHLIHPQEIPIIDQHNFRAMNHLLRIPSPKKKPSDWDDIAHLKSFLNKVVSRLPYSESDIDKYLMMYGRALKLRRSKSPIKEHA
ncbi:hypothetical protein [Pseudomonas sp. D(2018)]|uniref:hypothetical protein n=1 Tax=Pseudomonas sp. D(2018) TaxID=2502238 RepID=UPI0010F4D8CD|nr:hypothetical protein [Pseudomonas sp. D(2018)]